MGTLNDAFAKIVQQERFEQLVRAFDAACRWKLPRTTTLLGNRLQAMGAYIDDAGNWRQDTRRHQPVITDGDELGGPRGNKGPPGYYAPGSSHDAAVEL